MSPICPSHIRPNCHVCVTDTSSSHGPLNIWTSQYDLGCTTEWLETAKVSQLILKCLWYLQFFKTDKKFLTLLL